MGILFNNENDPSKGKLPQTELKQPGVPEKAVTADTSLEKKEEEFAIFPEWDLIPPNSIINPRIKKRT